MVLTFESVGEFLSYDHSNEISFYIGLFIIQHFTKWKLKFLSNFNFGLFWESKV